MDKGDEVPAALHEQTAASIEESIALLESWHGKADGRIRYCFAPRFAVSCTRELLEKVAGLAREHRVMVHTHASENTTECAMVESETGLRNVAYLDSLGLTGSHVALAHCVHLSDDEIDLLARTDTAVAHCPTSNMKLSSGAARIGDLRRAGVRVGIGSDGEKENNNLDLVEEMKFASLLQKVTTLDPTSGDPWDVLRMATIDGARATGIDAVSGSLEPGKRGDVITVDLRGLHTTPLLHGDHENVAAHLVFSARGSDVDDVWIDGARIVDGGVPVTFDVATVRSTAQAAAEELFERRDALLASGWRHPNAR